MSEVPRVKILEDINPINSGTGEEVLAYDGLLAAVEGYQTTNKQRTDAVWEAEPGSLEESAKAKQLALEYLLRISERVINPRQGDAALWADRFTQAGIEIYGEPEKEEAARLVTDEYRSLLSLRGDSRISHQHAQLLLGIYEPIIQHDAFMFPETTESDVGHEKAAIHSYGEAIREQYQPLFDLVDAADKSEFTPQDLEALFMQALDWLKDNDDPDWGEWKIIFVDSAQLSVQTTDRKIKIGSRRELASLANTKGLIAHELLVHALRAKNGYKTGDSKLATGLPGYLDSEEGLGILAEEAINGVLPDKAYDRYVDIALALGTIDGVQRSRPLLFQISYARQLVRAQLRGEVIGESAALKPKVWGHVDRIYRGGRGDSLGTRQAIFTKDIAYYVGYKQMAQYLVGQLAQGRTAKEVFSFLSKAKFDPNNPQHLERIAHPR